MQQVNLGMIGGGTVGSGVFHALQRNGGLLSSRIGVRIAVRKIAVKAPEHRGTTPCPESRAKGATSSSRASLLGSSKLPSLDSM
jgi:homoserine dehydrogenase